MGLKKILPFLAISVLSAAAVFGVVTYQKVSAQAPDPTATPAAPATTPQTQKGSGFMGGKVGEATDQYLADALSITTTQLSAAYQTATTAALKQAVADGKITQAQADQLAARGNGFMDGRWLNDANIDFNALLANALNISADQLKTSPTESLRCPDRCRGYRREYDPGPGRSDERPLCPGQQFPVPVVHEICI